MPGFYPEDEYDLAGFAVGIVDEKDLITGKEIREGDILLLCTDGLYGELSKEEIIAILQDDQDMQVLTERLVDRANQLGGRDNITAITVKVQGGNQNEQ